MPETLLLIFVFAFGASVGSFLNVCILRVPEGRSVVTPASSCPRCSSEIRFYDNIPVVSWLILRGRCRDCGEPISAQYPFVEALTGAFAVLNYIWFGATPHFVVFFIFTSALIVITFIDLKLQIIPDLISVPGMALCFVAAVLLTWYGGGSVTKGAFESALGMAVGYWVLYGVAWSYLRATGKEGMGGGDVKLMGMVGALLGWKGALFTIFIGALIGSVIGGAVMLAKKENMKYRVPFGPFLALGALIYIFYGTEMTLWYLRAMGVA